MWRARDLPSANKRKCGILKNKLLATAKEMLWRAKDMTHRLFLHHTTRLSKSVPLDKYVMHPLFCFASKAYAPQHKGFCFCFCLSPLPQSLDRKDTRVLKRHSSFTFTSTHIHTHTHTQIHTGTASQEEEEELHVVEEKETDSVGVCLFVCVCMCVCL